jgi:ABC-type nitrate/sulfonate/bicarbonate transport system ATPase subunit
VVGPTETTPGILSLEDVCFAYPDGTYVLDEISLSLRSGEILGIIGPSGSGKSTLLNIIAGLVLPTAGTIQHRFGPGSGHPLSMVFQKDTLMPWLTAAENVRLFARFKKHGLRRRFWHYGSGKAAARAELDRRVQELLELVGLGDRGDAYPYQLSGGMRRRLAFLSAIAANPQVLLLDEPFSSVDEPTRIGIHQDVLRISRMMGMTAVLVTHDLAEAITLSDRIVVLTNRPARIAKERPVPFGRERQVSELRETKEYQELYAGLWHELTTQIAASSTPAPQAGEHDGR